MSEKDKRDIILSSFKMLLDIYKEITEDIIFYEEDLSVGDDSSVESTRGFKAIDLGLPSGLKWCDRNLAADSPEGYGLFFTFDEANKADLGDDWRVPTKEDFQELYDNCESEWTTEGGVYGRRFTSKVNGNSVFFPASGLYLGPSLYRRGAYGYYWSASFLNSSYAYGLYFSSGSVRTQSGSLRRLGFAVRAVQNLSIPK